MDTRDEIIDKLSRTIANLTLFFLAAFVLALYLATDPFDENVVATDSASETSENVIPPPANKTAQLGAALFKQKCAGCHKMDRDFVGPKLQGAVDRAPDRETLAAWIRNSRSVLAEGNNYYQKLDKKYPSNMLPFTTLTDEDVDALIEYMDMQ